MKKLCFITFNPNQPGGGSELLWRRLALEMCEHSVEVHVAAPGFFDTEHPEVAQVRTQATSVTDLRPPPRGTLQRVAHKLIPNRIWHPVQDDPLKTWIERLQPDLIFVSLGGFKANLERLAAAGVMRHPYVVVMHGNRPDDWIEDARLPLYRTFHQSSQESWFVSQAARRFAQDALHLSPPHWTIVQNPTLLARDQRILSFPEFSSDPSVHFAMVGRLEYESKGFDLLIKAFSNPALRALPIQIHLYGSGPNERHLQEWIDQRELGSQIHLHGHQNDIARIWELNHVCLFTSRYEGMPIAMVEAMWCGRPVVTTRAGGCAELVCEGVSGVLIPEITSESIAETLIRVVERAQDLPAMGKRAAHFIRDHFEENPTRTQASVLLNLLENS